MNLEQIVQTFGYVGIIAIIFAESGLFFGFFLPGDSLLLTAGLLAWRIDPATGHPFLNLPFLLVTLPIAAILGDNVGYWFGKKTGPRIFNRENSRLFKRKNLLAAKAFYDKHGAKTIVLARFVPFIRTFAPIVAGAVEMEYRTFFKWNVLGGLLWAVGVTLVGYGIGTVFGATVDPETLDKYFLLLIIAVIFISALPTMIHLWRDNKDEILRRLRREPAPAKSPAEMVED
jgi:membrane-associated protein